MEPIANLATTGRVATLAFKTDEVNERGVNPFIDEPIGLGDNSYSIAVHRA